MNELKVIAKIKKKIEQSLSCKGHDITHVDRVVKLSTELAKYEENVDLFELELSAILHDIARVEEDTDTTGTIDHAELGSIKARKILNEYNLPEDVVDRICANVLTHRIRSNRVPHTIEGKILHDADKLDILGTVAIFRLVGYCCTNDIMLYHDIKFDQYIDINIDKDNFNKLKYKELHTPEMEYHLKLKKLPEKLYTEKAREVAKKRLKTLEEFFINFNNELELKDF